MSRHLSPYFRSTGELLSGLVVRISYTSCSISGLTCVSNLPWVSLLLSWITSWNLDRRSSWYSIWLVTYHAGSVVARKIFDWARWIMATLDFHSTIPYAQVDLITALWRRILFSNDIFKFLRSNQLVTSFILRSVCLRLFIICSSIKMDSKVLHT